MENKTSKKWWIIFSILLVLVLGFLVYKNYDTIKRYFGFAAVYDAAANRAIQDGNDWKITSGSYAWGENIGWVDFAPAEGVTVLADNALWGYAYGENVGWISLNCANTDTCGTVNYKVSNNGEGKLSGFAWGENIGWVDFGTSTDIANRTWGVSISSAGDFTGYAYGENIGWISFNSANGGSVVYKVSTNWRPQSTRPLCNNGLDDDNDTYIDYPDDRNCSSLTDTRERSSSGGSSVTTEYPASEVIIPVSTNTVTASTTASTTIVVLPPTTKPIIVNPVVGPGVSYQEFTGTFTRDLYLGISGGDVKELQKFLNREGYAVAISGVGSAGNETTFYGNRTRDAVTKLQEVNAGVILAPYELATGTGYFGKTTRAFVNAKLNN